MGQVTDGVLRNSGVAKKGSGGGGGGGGDGKFPTFVTSSGSSLPVDLTGYNEGDTFLNTSDKKIYKIASIYSLSSDYTNVGSLDVSTGEITGFSTSKYLYRGFGTIPVNNIDIRCKTGSDITTEQCIVSHFYSYQGTNKAFFSVIVKGGSLIVVNNDSQSETIISQVKVNTEYRITGSVTYSNNQGLFNIVAYEEETQIYSGVVLVAVSTSPFPTKTMYFGVFREDVVSYKNPFLGIIYGDSNWVSDICVANLSWDNGTDLTDKTEYADKTNGALYLYSDDELVKIGGSLTKKVYTISADNTSTLDVSSDFTRIVDVLKNGVELALTDDYTISSGVITFVTALSTTDKITVKGD